MYSLTLSYHRWILYSLILAQIFYFFLKKEKKNGKFFKNFSFLLLFQTILLSMLIFTGFVMLALRQFENIFFFEVELMFLISVGIGSVFWLCYRKVKNRSLDEMFFKKVYLFVIFAEVVFIAFLKVS